MPALRIISATRTRKNAASRNRLAKRRTPRLAAKRKRLRPAARKRRLNLAARKKTLKPARKKRPRLARKSARSNLLNNHTGGYSPCFFIDLDISQIVFTLSDTPSAID